MSDFITRVMDSPYAKVIDIGDGTLRVAVFQDGSSHPSLVLNYPKDEIESFKDNIEQTADLLGSMETLQDGRIETQMRAALDALNDEIFLTEECPYDTKYNFEIEEDTRGHLYLDVTHRYIFSLRRE